MKCIPESHLTGKIDLKWDLPVNRRESTQVHIQINNIWGEELFGVENAESRFHHVKGVNSSWFNNYCELKNSGDVLLNCNQLWLFKGYLYQLVFYVKIRSIEMESPISCLVWAEMTLLNLLPAEHASFIIQIIVKRSRVLGYIKMTKMCNEVWKRKSSVRVTLDHRNSETFLIMGNYEQHLNGWSIKVMSAYQYLSTVNHYSL